MKKQFCRQIDVVVSASMLIHPAGTVLYLSAQTE